MILSVWMAGCAIGPQTPPAVEGARERGTGVVSGEAFERMRARVTVGKSSKAEVAAALGKASPILIFDSGFEVWVYRIRAPKQAQQGDAEFVLLFAPSGTLAKTRLRLPIATS